MLFIILFCFFIGNIYGQQSSKLKILKTKWFYKEDNIDDVYLIFNKNGRFIRADEDANIYYGYYTCSGDTITTIDDSSKYDKKDFRKCVVISILKNNRLVPIYSKWDDLKALTKFDTNAIMYKDTTCKAGK